ncbi:MAG: FHA domain-containing protein [Acidimicrobiales bacterium]
MPAAGESCLVVVRGPNAGSRFMLYKDVTTLGREGDSDVLLNDVTVSRAQAEILRQDRSWVLVDRGSMNGTYVNGARIEARVRLAHGDQLQVGRFVIFFLQP